MAGQSQEVIRIRMEAYDHSVLDQSAAEIVDTAKRTEFGSPRADSACPRGSSGTRSCQARTSTRRPASSSRFARTSV